MAGHSKWANIKHKKARQDKKRGKIFTKLIREITVASKLGGPDAGSNPRLRAAVQAALGANMTRDTIDKAIKRGAGDDDGTIMEEIRYEGYGVGGVAVIVDCLSDNRNRTVGEVRHAFTKCGGNLGTDGSVAYLFTKQGMISFAPGADEEKLMELAIEAGAEDIQMNDDGSADVITTPEAFGDVNDALEAAGLTPDNAEVTMVPTTSADLEKELALKIIKMVDMLEDCDDVQNVYTNAEFPEDAYD